MSPSPINPNLAIRGIVAGGYTESQDNMSVESLFVNACAAKLDQFTSRIAICLARLTESQIWARGHENENAVGNLVLHLSGNVRQWIMSGLGGQPDVRVRDREFAASSGMSGEEL